MKTIRNESEKLGHDFGYAASQLYLFLVGKNGMPNDVARNLMIECVDQTISQAKPFLTFFKPNEEDAIDGNH